MHWIYFCFLVSVLKLFISHVNTSSDSEIKNEKDKKACNGDFILIATVDGMITALDMNSGEKCWSSLVDPEGFLSSTLSEVELYEKNQRMVLVPSLDGGIYKYNIKNKMIQPIAGNVDSLISNSVYYDPSVNVVGGKMKEIFGIHRLSGEVIYSCKINGCNVFNMPFPENVIVIENMIQWVKTIDLLKAEEKWHFRVVELKIKLPSLSFNEDLFLSNGNDLIPTNFNEEYTNLDGYKVSLPNAFVGRINESREDFAWLFKTAHPITDVWYLKDRVLKDIDPFEKESDFISLDMEDGKQLALLFLGIYQNQMFIKKSKFYMNSFNVGLLSENIYQNDFPVCPKTEDIVIMKGSLDNSSLIPTHMNLSVDHGVYFYVDISAFGNSSGHSGFIAENETHCLSNSSFILTSGNRLNFRESLFLMAFCVFMLACCLVYGIMNKGVIYVTCTTPFQLSEDTTQNIEFKSRFHQDFELSCILGKGGFGIVMDAKNKIDDCHYAIKRICLDDKLMNSSKYERVLREVKALAKLDHHGIVRYFNAWVEYPPAGWQEKKDIEHNMHITEKSDCLEKIANSKTKSSVKESSPSKRILKSFIRERKDQNPFKLDEDIFFHDKLSKYKGDFSDYSEPMSTNRQYEKHNKNPFKLDNDISSTSDESNSKSTKRQYRNILSNKDKSSDDDDDSIIFENSNKNMNLDPRAEFISKADVTFSKDNSVDHDIAFHDSEKEIILENAGAKAYGPEKFLKRYSAEGNINAVKEGNELTVNESIRNSKSLFVDKGSHELFNPDQSCISKKNATLGYLYIQMQLCKRESLRDWLDDNPKHREYDIVLKIFFDIVDAVHYVHNCGLMHRDLKPSNILFSLDGAIKIGDFGLATSSEIEKHISSCQEMSAHTSDIGTEIYMSPEQKQKEDYNSKTDIFSLGIILFELLVPFQTYSERYKALLQLRALNFPEGFQSTFKNESILLQQLLANNPKCRPTAKEIKEHPLLKKYV